MSKLIAGHLLLDRAINIIYCSFLCLVHRLLLLLRNCSSTVYIYEFYIVSGACMIALSAVTEYEIFIICLIMWLELELNRIYFLLSTWVNWLFNCPMSAWASPGLIDILIVLKPTKTHALFVLIHDVALFARHWLIDWLSLSRVVTIILISLFLFIATGSTEDWEPEAKGREWCVNTRHQQVIKVNFIERSD